MNSEVFIHPTAMIEKGVTLGPGTKIWDNVHIRKNAQIGRDTMIGGKSYIAYDVKIGDLVKINASVYICAGVTVKDKVMIAAGTIFTNDRFPRAVSPDANELMTSDPTEETEETMVEEGVTIGAGAVIGCGITLGEYSMIGMASVVTKNVPPYALVFGSPARIKGYVCKCGHPLDIKGDKGVCVKCARKYSARPSSEEHLVIKPA